MPHCFPLRPAAGPPGRLIFSSRFAAAASLALGLGLPTRALAQNRPDPDPLRHPVLVNIKGGFNLSTYTGGGYIGWETGLKGGFSAGLLATRALSARSAWQVELLYSRKGAVAYDYWHTYAAPAPPTGPRDNTYRSELHYLDLPVLFTYGPGSGSRHGWYLAAGPQLSLAFDRQETVVPANLSDADSYRETLDSGARDLTRWGLGYAAGIGYQATGGGAGIELRYSGDFTNVYRDGYGSGALYAGSSNRFHNGVIQLQVNLALRGGHWVRGSGGWQDAVPHDVSPPSPGPQPRRRPEPSPQPQPKAQPRQRSEGPVFN